MKRVRDGNEAHATDEWATRLRVDAPVGIGMNLRVTLSEEGHPEHNHGILVFEFLTIKIGVNELTILHVN